MKRLHLILLLGIGVIAALMYLQPPAFLRLQSTTDSNPDNIAIVQRGDFSRKIQLVAQVESQKQLYLGAPFNAKLAVIADDGKTVKAGDEIAQLETQDIEERLEEKKLELQGSIATLSEHDRNQQATLVGLDAQVQTAQNSMALAKLALKQLQAGTPSEELKKLKLQHDLTQSAFIRAKNDETRKGAEQEAIEQIAAFGLNNIRIYAEPLNEEEQLKAQRTPSIGLSQADAEYIKTTLPYVTAIAPQNLIDKSVYYREHNPEAQLVGTTPAYLPVSQAKLAAGRFLNAEDLTTYRKVCVLSHELVKSLFLEQEPLGAEITLGGQRFTVVGYLADPRRTKERVQIKARKTQNDIYIPLSTSLKKFSMSPYEDTPHNQTDYHVIDEISLEVSGPEYLAPARTALESILKRRHYGIPDYEIVVPTELLEQSQQTQRLFNLVMGCIAGLSLLVGGIGIMNIMLASVTERTRQIGIRRAIGATPNDILVFFLLESMLISLIGGIIGIVVGISLSGIVSWTVGWKTMVSITAILLSFGVSSLVGIFFGLYPAWRASQMDPITALRHE